MSEEKGKVPSDEQVAVGTAVATGVAAAGASLLGPEAALAAAGISPIVADRLNSIYSNRVRQALESLIVSDETLTTGPESDLKIELLREYCAAQFSTRTKTKFDMLRQATQNGLSANSEREVLFAKRIVRVLDSLDDHEVSVVTAVFLLSQNSEDVVVASIAEKVDENDTILIQASISSLVSSGLVSLNSADTRKVEITEFGHVLLSHL